MINFKCQSVSPKPLVKIAGERHHDAALVTYIYIILMIFEVFAKMTLRAAVVGSKKKKKQVF